MTQNKSMRKNCRELSKFFSLNIVFTCFFLIGGANSAAGVAASSFSAAAAAAAKAAACEVFGTTGAAGVGVVDA